MERVVDPEFDERPPVKPGECLLGKCDGTGWIQVSEAYVDHAAGPPPSIPEGETPHERAMFEAEHRGYRAKRAALTNTSYPCPSCMPIQFERWSGGHWEPRHDRDACDDCRRVDASTGKRVRGRKRREEPERAPEPTWTPPPEEPEQIRADLR